jgi:amidase
MAISRRQFMAAATAASLSSFAGTLLAAPSRHLDGVGEIEQSSATALARAIRSGLLSSEEVVEVYLQRINALNGTLNAIVQLDLQGAIAAARRADKQRASGMKLGALHGVPITIKDSLDTAGMVSTAGTLGRAAFVPQADATVVARLRAAGAIVLGKTNTPELTFSLETDNLVYGRTVNPYDVKRSPGGSSGGAAAAIAAGMSALDVGSDTGASVRYPAHCCGIAGLKPTHGRVPRTGHIISFAGVSESLTTLGPLARRVEDLDLILRIIAGPDSYDPHIAPAPIGDAGKVNLNGLRAATYTQVGQVDASEATMKAIGSASDSLRDAGVTIESTSPPRLTEAIDLFFGMFAGDGGEGLKGFLDMLGTTEPSAPVRAALKLLNQGAMSTKQYNNFVVGLDLWRSELLAFMDRYDVLICPVSAHPAPKSLTTFETREDVLPPELFAYTAPFNLTGWPVAVVRIGQAVGDLPIGVQIVAKPWREDVALAVAAHLEKSLGGFVAPVL